MDLFDGSTDPAAQPGSVGSPVGVADLAHDVVREQLSGELDESLPDDDRTRLEEHVRSCGSCRAYRATLRATVRAVSSLPQEKAPALAKRRLFEIAEL